MTFCDFFFFNTYYACLSHGLSQRRLWSSGHMIRAPLNPPNHPARSQLCFPNPINIFYALSSFASPNIYLSPSSLFFLFPTFRSHSAIIWPQALLSSVSFKLPLRLIALTTSYTLTSEICVSKFHQIASLGLKFGRRPVKNKPLRAGLQWEVGGGMGPVISAGLEGTLGQKCMTQQKKKGRSSASALMLMADLGPWLWAALQTKEEQPPPRRPGLVWETSGTVRWSTSVGNISAPQTGRGTFTKKKEKGTGSSPGLWHLNEDVQTQHAPSWRSGERSEGGVQCFYQFLYF